VPYNPQQNEIAERKNRAICEAAKAMMCDQDLPTSLWAEATSTAVYIQNRSPCAIMGEKTLEEPFTGENPEVGHLRIFGCPVYIHVSKYKRTKMEPSGKKGIFVGYSETSKAFKIYVPGQRHIEVSRNVTFHEEAAFKQSKELQLDTEMEEPKEPLDQFDTMDPVKQIERPLEVPPAKRKPAWCREILQEAEKHASPSGTFRESNRPQRYSGYVPFMSQISDAEPTIYEDVAKQQVWKDAMVEEYQSIMKNDVWEVVPRPKGK
jgi:hypothetical protein